MNPIIELKQIQKNLVNKIRENHEAWDSVVFRHQHIAYCQLRGRKREVIEKPSKDNAPNEDWITKLMNEWSNKIQIWREHNEK